MALDKRAFQLYLSEQFGLGEGEELTEDMVKEVIASVSNESDPEQPEVTEPVQEEEVINETPEVLPPATEEDEDALNMALAGMSSDVEYDPIDNTSPYDMDDPDIAEANQSFDNLFNSALT